MIDIAHLLDDFGMGGVTRALKLFEEPEIARMASSRVIPIKRTARLAPQLKADMIVDHMPFSWARLPFLTSLRARNPKAHIVHIEHSYTRSFEGHEVTAKGRFRTMIRTASRLVDEFVCVSEAQRDWLARDVRVPLAKLKVINPWTDRRDLLKIKPVRDRGDGPLNLLAYGRFAGVKNFAELITAMRSFSHYEVRLTLFGDGPERNLLKALASDLPHVDVFGRMDDPSVFLELCDAVIIPSRYEAFGLVAAEARLAGRALIVADVDGLPEQAHGFGRVAQLGCAYDIVQAIRGAMQADVVEMGAASRRSAKSYHAHILNQWTQMIRHCGGRRPEPSTPDRALALGGAAT